MSRFRFELAGPADDDDLRHVLAETPTPGTVALSFRREPSFFAASSVDGFRVEVVACRDTETGRIIGFGCRCLRRLFVNGEERTVGYLSSLRVLTRYRNRGLIARGYAFFNRLHTDGQATLYLTTIADGNAVALAVLTAGRAGLPRYHAAGLYHTFAIPSRGIPAEVQPARAEERAEIVAFWQRVGPRRQFFPAYTEDDLFAERGGSLLGLRPGDLWIARRRGDIVGTLGAWDQHAFKQTVVVGYGGWLRWLRPAVNAWATLRGQPRLPRPGEAMRYRVAAVPCVEGDDPAVFDALLRAAAGSGSGHLMIGLHERDPLAPTAALWAAARYTTRLFVVCRDDGKADRSALDGRPPYLEVGSL